MRLRVVDTRPPELPRGQALAGGVRRPGDTHDVIVIPNAASRAIEQQAAASLIPSALAVTLLIELRLLERDLTAVALPLPAAPEPVIDQRLSAAQANYLRALTWHRPGFVPFDNDTTALPVRLLAGATPETLMEAARIDLELALRWEAAAIAAGRGMGEFGLLCALRRAGAV
jgi:hypothetical protein